MYRILSSLCLLFAVTAASGCSDTTIHAKPLAVGAVSGAAAGAGTGAIVGAIIANGDIAASALLGGAVGIPVGLALGALYDYNSQENVAQRKQKEINRNQDEIYTRQRELDDLREQIRNDGPSGNPSESDRYYHYNGNTYGNYYR
jgi:H+/gluconate symporter-like permease